MTHLKRFFMLFFIPALFSGCAMISPKVVFTDIDASFAPGTIISSEQGTPIQFDAMIEQVGNARVVFVGERHTNQPHHDIQLKILRRLAEIHPNLTVGMEMFDQTYQPLLDQWSAGKLEEKEFIRKSHWYANWGYGFTLYRDILMFIKEKNIPLFGLNLPFHLPSKIAVGGLDSLRDFEKRHLPARIGTSNEAHREYLKKIFEQHTIPGRDDFETFYQAQCAWEDTMAANAAKYLDRGPMLVLLGNGHIINKFGVPDRVMERKTVSIKTVYLAAAGSEAELSYADFIWVTAPPVMPKMPPMAQ